MKKELTNIHSFIIILSVMSRVNLFLVYVICISAFFLTDCVSSSRSGSREETDMDTDKDGVMDLDANGLPLDQCVESQNEDFISDLGPSDDPSLPSNDYDADGCEDSIEDDDDNGDDIPDTDADGDGLGDLVDSDDNNDGVEDNDLDGDGLGDLADSDIDGDNEDNDVDVDDDNDGLIEIGDGVIEGVIGAEMLNNIRYNLIGTGYKIEAGFLSEPDPRIDAGNQNGCPDNGGCNGYELVSNIDLDVTVSPNWVGVGTLAAVAFDCIFEGNNYTIQNLMIDNNDASQRFTGFILTSLGEIRNLRFENGSVTGQDNMNTTPAMNPYVGVVVGVNAGIIRNLSVVDVTVLAQNNSLPSIVGGLVGSNQGVIDSSYATGNIRGYSEGDQIGGLVGWNEGSLIQNSYATGDVNGGTGAQNVLGGLVGLSDHASAIGIIQNCYATGDVDGGAGDLDFAGGLVGRHISGRIENSYATGSVTAGTDTNDFADGLTLILNINGVQDTGIVQFSYSVAPTIFSMRRPLGDLKELSRFQTGKDFGFNNRWSEQDWDFTDDTKLPTLRSYKENDDNNQVKGDLLCGQLPMVDFVQCEPEN